MIRSLLLCLALQCLAQPLPTRRFDMGTESSPVAPGFVRITPQSAYSQSVGYGWESREQTAFDVPKPAEDPSWNGPAGQRIPKEYLIHKEHTAVSRDGVSSKQDLVFRADVPNGVYRVAITLGRLDQPRCSMQVSINEQLVATDVDARHFWYRGRPDYQHGFPKKIRRTVRVTGGVVRVRIHGDESGFLARFREEHKKPVPNSYLTGGSSGHRKPEKPDPDQWGKGNQVVGVWVWQDIGGPFTENSVNAIEIYPYVEPPLTWKENRLAAAAMDAGLQRAAALFNRKQWAAAEKAFDAVADDYSRALGYLWLAGRPEYEEELRLAPQALAILRKIASRRPGDLMFAETLELAARFHRAIDRFVHRAARNRTYTELLLVSGEVDSLQPDDPTYYKGLLYAARGLYMVIPHRWAFTAGAGRQILEELEKAGFADNRYVRWYLHDDWSSAWPDWAFPDYTDKKNGAPAWAAQIYEVYNRELDLAEWWMRNRQQDDGSLGGGWGDDVEILRSFGAFAAVSLDASPLTVRGVRKVADGAWSSGSVDTKAGYFAEVADTEHSGEWTADTLTAMTRIDYGNPVYLERGLKTAKLMRDLWMDYSSRGHLLMRSNFLGATGIGRPGTHNDSRINYRPASPALAVLRYNNLPSLRKLFVEWADSWLAASMSTEKGKPRGIIPQEIGSAHSEMGGEKAPTWYAALNAPGADGNYDWEGLSGYHEAIVELLLLAHKATGDPKYLEPMDLQAAFVRQHCPRSVLESELYRQGRLHDSLWESLPPGSNGWIAARLALWPKQWEATRRVLFPEHFSDQPELLSLDDAAGRGAEENEWARKRWPHVTTEAIATDRIYWRGLGNAVRTMSAYGVFGQIPQVTYRGLGREFAAAVLRLTSADLKVVMYNMTRQSKQAVIVPWLLEVGDEYSFQAGPDENNDGKMDRVVENRQVRLRSQGQEVPYPLPGRVQYVVEMKRTARGGNPSTLPDLGLSEPDVRFVAEYRRVDVTVHNVGAARARRVLVALFHQGKELGRELIPNIEAPLDLDPKTVRVSFPFEPRAKAETFTVVVDPDGAIDEITERNNRLTVELATPLAPRRQHSHP